MQIYWLFNRYSWIRWDRASNYLTSLVMVILEANITWLGNDWNIQIETTCGHLPPSKNALSHHIIPLHFAGIKFKNIWQKHLSEFASIDQGYQIKYFLSLWHLVTMIIPLITTIVSFVYTLQNIFKIFNWEGTFSEKMTCFFVSAHQISYTSSFWNHDEFHVSNMMKLDFCIFCTT